MKVISCKVTNEQGEVFRVLCEAMGKSMNQVLRSWVLGWEERSKVETKKEEERAVSE